jgi:hypothetical protein
MATSGRHGEASSGLKIDAELAGAASAREHHGNAVALKQEGADSPQAAEGPLLCRMDDQRSSND